jgi:hypothetical protein
MYAILSDRVKAEATRTTLIKRLARISGKQVKQLIGVVWKWRSR